MLKVLVVVEDLEMRCLSFFIWVFLYCNNVFSLLLKVMFCRFVKVGSSSFGCRDVLVLAISVWRWLILIFVHLILLWVSEHFIFLYHGLFKLIAFPFDCKVLGATLFARHLRLKILADSWQVVFLTSPIFLLPVEFHGYKNL